MSFQHLCMGKIGIFFTPTYGWQHILCLQQPKNHSQIAITQQWIARFTQTKHQNLPLNILFTLLDFSNIQKIWKNHLKKVNFSLFSNFWLQTPMVPVHGTGNFFQYLGYHLPPIPFTITRIKIFILCTILLCSVQHILIQITKNHILTFNRQKLATNITIASNHQF